MMIKLPQAKPNLFINPINSEITTGIILIVTVLITKISVLNLPYHWDVMAYVFDYSDAILKNNLWLFPIVEEGDPGHPPFYFAILATIWKFFGRELYISHAVGVVFTWLALYYTYLFGKRILCDSAIGFLAAILLFFNPLCFAQFGTLNLSVPLTALLIMSAYHLVQRRYTFFVLCASSLALTKAEGFILVSILLVVYFIIFDIHPAGPRIDVKELVIKYFFLSLPILLYFTWFILHFKLTGILLNSEKFAHTRGVNLSPELFLSSFVEKFKQCFLETNILNSLGIVLVCLPFKKQNQFDQRKLNQQRSAVLFLLILTSINLIFFTIVKAWIVRYAMPIYPFIFLLGAAGFIKIIISFINSQRKYLSFFLSILVISNVLLFVSGYDLHRSGYGSWEDNLEYIDIISINQDASHYIEERLPSKKVFASWPLSHALRNPYLGYVKKPINVVFKYEEADIFLFTSSPWYEEGEKLQAMIQQKNTPLIKRFERNGKYIELYQKK
ncbi:hypothetical protein H6F43_02900 [Leptolyngbya sp. FACHB-36]|uniref:ArnT family glycosyltransferase n=1 Tax=Leptolyngbya sp. FACHB-36 TaxID=2692808 RepID=UPI0016801D02|nr:hypothetical protein [Leptolyngbya sp. FACHB-36]MBD2019133.1 hypothetical protein [Leptolyngbya sp. FACHB-36]